MADRTLQGIAPERETIQEYLARVRRKDLAKGFDGYRTTRQVAEFYQWSSEKARRRLNTLWEKGEIEAARYGGSILWRALYEQHAGAVK